jgi:hypothetical protein
MAFLQKNDLRLLYIVNLNYFEYNKFPWKESVLCLLKE